LDRAFGSQDSRARYGITAELLSELVDIAAINVRWLISLNDIAYGQWPRITTGMLNTNIGRNADEGFELWYHLGRFHAVPSGSAIGWRVRAAVIYQQFDPRSAQDTWVIAARGPAGAWVDQKALDSHRDRHRNAYPFLAHHYSLFQRAMRSSQPLIRSLSERLVR
jgi:hypothetical protein